MARRFHRRDPHEVEELHADDKYGRLLQRYPEVFPDQSEQSLQLARLFGMFLRKAWRAPTSRERAWYLADAESLSHRQRECFTIDAEPFRSKIAVDRFLDPPPTATPLEALLTYFRRSADRALYCPNPDCVAPYFLSKKKGQKWCSDACAVASLRESKRRWWRENRAKKAKES